MQEPNTPNRPASKPECLRLFLSYQDDFMGYLFSLTENREACLEIFQNAAVAIMEHEKLDEVVNFRAWSRELLRRQAMLYLRSESTRMKHCRTLDPQLVDAVSDVFVECGVTKDQRFALNECFGRLAVPQQRIVDLRYGGSFSFDQIATMIDSTAVAVQRSLSRIREQLRRCVERKLAEERS